MATTQQSWSNAIQNIILSVQEIIRSEMRLAQAEMKERAQEAARASISLVVGVILGLYAAGFLFLCAVYALGLVLPAWLAALLVGLLIAVFALVFLATGWKKMKTVETKPVETIESVKETVQWAKNQSS